MKFEYSRQIFKKYSNIKYENLSSGSQVVHADGSTDGQTRVMKLIVAFFTILWTRLIKATDISSFSVYEERLAHVFASIYLTRH